MALVEIPEGSYVNLPPNSFSSADILRITAIHLTRVERLHIIYFFCIVFPTTGFMADLIELISLIFKPTKVITKILKLFRAWDAIVNRINPINASLLLMVLPHSVRIEAMKLLKVLEREFYLEE